MTGAQDAEGARGIPEITHKLAAEGGQIVVVADEPGVTARPDLADGTLLWPRERLGEPAAAARHPGVTVLIYDQHCANDARRQRKRSTPTLFLRIVINEDVCEGCGDCGVKSNCLSGAAAAHRVRREDAASTRRRATPTTPASRGTARRS